MKLAHLADLHIGKRIYNFSMLVEQKYILQKISKILQEERVDAVLIAGDVYDTPLPPIEAVQLLDAFLTDLAKAAIKVFIISGNHDSAQRLSFGTNLLAKSAVYISPPFNGTTEPIELVDEFGLVYIYLLPFLKPIYAKKAWPDEVIQSYDDAVRIAVQKMQIDESKRNVIVSHQFVTGATTSESEEINIGGLDNISATIFAPFDYAALGHIHRPQQIGSPKVRYAGTPLCYSFSECGQDKTMTIVELAQKGNVEIATRALKPLHAMRQIRGSYEELTLRENYIHEATKDYLSIVLTNEDEIPDAISKLRIIYPNIMKLSYDNKRSKMDAPLEGNKDERLQPLDLLQEFYCQQNNKELNNEQETFVKELISQIWEA